MWYAWQRLFDLNSFQTLNVAAYKDQPETGMQAMEKGLWFVVRVSE